MAETKLIIWDFRNTIYNTDTKSFNKGAREVLEHFKNGYTQILVTASADAEERIREIEGLQVDHYFKEIIISSKTKEVFKKVLNDYKTNAENAVIIGDQYSSEIAIGNELGMRTIWFVHGNPDEVKLGIKYWKKIRGLDELLNMDL